MLYFNTDSKITQLTELVEKLVKNPSCDCEEIKLCSSNVDIIVFKTNQISNMVFKFSTRDSIVIEERFKNIEKCIEICVDLNLDLLKIPYCEIVKIIIQGKTYSVLAEEEVPFNPSVTYQQSLHLDESNNLDNIIDQLYRFIWKSGWSDVEYRNMPLYFEEGVAKAALFDLEEFQGRDIGLFGSILRTGLIGLVNQRLAQSIVDKAVSQSTHQPDSLINPINAQMAYITRLTDIENFVKLTNFYEKHKIVKGKELVQADTKSWHLTVTSNDLLKKINQAYKDILDEVNDYLKNANESTGVDIRQGIPIKGLDIDLPAHTLSENLQRRIRLNSYRCQYFNSSSNLFFVENPDKTIMAICLNNLLKKEVIYDFKRVANDYTISV